MSIQCYTPTPTVLGDDSSLNERIFLFPDSLPDEIHVSQTGRLHCDSGNLSTRQTFLDTYGTAPFRLTQWIPTNLEIYAAKLPGDPIQNIENLLRNNTLYPLFETFGDARFTPTSHATPLRQQITNMPKRVVGESGETHLCVECLRQDREEHGYPYIHRSHQIPGVSVCWRHGTLLLSACPFCACPFEAKADLVLAPWVPCPACQQYLPDTSFYSPAQGTELENAYAKFTHELLIASPGPLSNDTLATIYSDRLHEAGYSRGKLINRSAMREGIEKHYGMKFLQRVDAAIRSQRDQQWFRFLYRSGLADTPLPRHLLLANFLFGSAESFVAVAKLSVADLAVKAAKVNVQGRSPTTHPDTEKEPPYKVQGLAPVSSEPDSKLSRANGKILAYLAKFPTASIDDLWKNHHGAMKQITKSGTSNSAWLEGIRSTHNTSAIAVPVAPQGSINDLDFAQKVAATVLAEYSSIDKPTRVTRNFLLRKIDWNPPRTVNPQTHPLTTSQLNLGVESEWHFYARRIVWAILTGGQQAAAYWRVTQLSKVEHHRGKLLVGFFSDLSPIRTLRIGTIADILSEYKIDRQWCGPNPDQEFYPRGRSYVRRQLPDGGTLTPPQLP